jgi:hypothetical protein
VDKRVSNLRADIERLIEIRRVTAF